MARTRVSSESSLVPRRGTYHQQSIIILQPIHFVQEERTVVVVHERVDIFEYDETRGFLASSRKDLADTCAGGEVGDEQDQRVYHMKHDRPVTQLTMFIPPRS